MEALNYFDKTEALRFIMEEAKRQCIPTTRLCDGIIDPSNFTKMVKGKANREIKFEVLVQIAHRLKITDATLMSNSLIGDMSLLNEISALRLQYEKRNFKELERQLLEYTRKYNYEKSKLLTQNELWLSGVVEAMNYHNYNEALAIFTKALELSNEQFTFPLENFYLNEIEVEIYNSYLFVTGYYENECELALIEYERLREYLDHRVLKPYVKARVYYNYGLLLTGARNYEKANEIVNNGIRYCITNNELTLLPYYYYLSFIIYRNIDDLVKAKEAYQKALLLMEIYEVPTSTIMKVREASEQLDIGFWMMNNV